MKDDAPQVPQPSASEVALQTSQKEMLDLQKKLIEKSQREQELLAPVLYRQLGITPKMNDKGEVIGYDEGPQAAQKQEIENLLLQRSSAALKGELPVNPALTRDLGEQEARLKEGLFRQLGPGWETSTPGIEAVANFEKRRAELFDASRRGDITLAESLSLARDASGLNSNAATVNVANRFLPNVSAGTGVASGYGNAASLLAQDRLAQYQGELQAYNADQRTFGQLLGGIGSLAGTVGGAFAYGKLFK